MFVEGWIYNLYIILASRHEPGGTGSRQNSDWRLWQSLFIHKTRSHGPDKISKRGINKAHIDDSAKENEAEASSSHHDVEVQEKSFLRLDA